ncbi:hypothetical protein [Olleya sp. R77988]|uniref:hypothetical protein n=1 Tax=Olleya sp. R77988 TaxID=3093875 RepID=UPI0037C6A1DF
MKTFKFFQYAYLVFAALFLYDAFFSWEERGVMSLILGLTAVFMFFFKKKFNKKFDNQDRK